MKIKLTFFCLICLLLCVCCNKHAAELATCKAILYSDSTYMYPVDSLIYTNYGDTTYFNKEFRLNGYFRIYPDYHFRYEEGMLQNGQKIGTWRYYSGENCQLDGVENYNDQSELHGEQIFYDNINGKLIAYNISNYIHGHKQGIQKEFFESGALSSCYELDSTGAYINDYFVLYENGDTLYYENFGNLGTGWLKECNNNAVLYEVQLINKKREGWLYAYITDSEINQRVLNSKTLYKNDIILSKSIYFLKGEKYKNSDIDSIVGLYKYDYINENYVDNSGEYLYVYPYRIIYYHKGKILGIEKKSPYFD